MTRIIIIRQALKDVPWSDGLAVSTSLEHDEKQTLKYMDTKLKI